MTKAERQEQLERLLLEQLPANGSTVGNGQLLVQRKQEVIKIGNVSHQSCLYRFCRGFGLQQARQAGPACPARWPRAKHP